MSVLQREWKTEPCFLLLADLVGYSKKPEKDQLEDVKNLLEVWIRCIAKDPPLSEDAVLIPIGDGFIAVLPTTNGSTTPLLNIFRFLKEIFAQNKEITARTLDLHVGLHFGSCVPVAIEKASISYKGEANNFLGYDVNYVARLASCAKSGQVIASRRFIDKIEDDLKVREDLPIPCYDCFEVTFKGDTIDLSNDAAIRVIPSASRILAPDHREVYNLLLDDHCIVCQPPYQFDSVHGAQQLSWNTTGFPQHKLPISA